MNKRTRIKICGLTRPEDVHAAVQAGADAIGFNFYEKSPRYINSELAVSLSREVAPFVSIVGLFVNAAVDEVERVLQQVPLALLQFHGDESVEDCAAIADKVKRPFIRAVRVKPDMSPGDLLKYEAEFRASSAWFSGLLLDAFVDGYGGGGKVFDWSVIPKELAPRLVLSGGLSEHNVADAVRVVHPYAADVSSGVEQAKGIKDAARINAFIQAVRAADAELKT